MIIRSKFYCARVSYGICSLGVDSLALHLEKRMADYGKGKVTRSRLKPRNNPFRRGVGVYGLEVTVQG